MKSVNYFSNLNAWSLAVRKFSPIQSNALKRSVKTAPISPPLSMILHHFSSIG